MASLIVGWILFPKALYSQEQQPIDFNHTLHSGLVSNGCESCHFFREEGTYSGVPKLAQCIECHEEAQGSNPEEIKFVEQYVKKKRLKCPDWFMPDSRTVSFSLMLLM